MSDDCRVNWLEITLPRENSRCHRRTGTQPTSHSGYCIIRPANAGAGQGHLDTNGAPGPSINETGSGQLLHLCTGKAEAQVVVPVAR